MLCISDYETAAKNAIKDGGDYVYTKSLMCDGKIEVERIQEEIKYYTEYLQSLQNHMADISKKIFEYEENFRKNG